MMTQKNGKGEEVNKTMYTVPKPEEREEHYDLFEVNTDNETGEVTAHYWSSHQRENIARNTAGALALAVALHNSAVPTHLYVEAYVDSKFVVRSRDSKAHTLFTYTNDDAIDMVISANDTADIHGLNDPAPSEEIVIDIDSSASLEELEKILRHALVRDLPGDVIDLEPHEYSRAPDTTVEAETDFGTFKLPSWSFDPGQDKLAKVINPPELDLANELGEKGVLLTDEQFEAALKKREERAEKKHRKASVAGHKAKKK